MHYHSAVPRLLGSSCKTRGSNCKNLGKLTKIQIHWQASVMSWMLVAVDK